MSDILKFTLRIPQEVHSDLKKLAKLDNRSMNNYLVTILEKHVEDNRNRINNK